MIGLSQSYHAVAVQLFCLRTAILFFLRTAGRDIVKLNSMKKLFAALCFLLLMAALVPAAAHAQSEDERIRAFDSRIMVNRDGSMLVTETIIEPIKPSYGAVVKINMDTAHRNLLSIVVSKSNYMLCVRYGNTAMMHCAMRRFSASARSRSSQR